MSAVRAAEPAAAVQMGDAVALPRPPLSPLGLVVLVLGAFVGMVDATIVAVALDPLGRRFGVPLSTSQAVIAVYLVVVTATLPTLGRLGDRFGRRRAYCAGFAVFGAGSLLAVLAPSFGVLLAGRVVQAAGGGLLTAGSLALIATYAPSRSTGRRVALLVVAQAVAGLVGPPVGGVLVALFGWQAVFWAGVPIALAGVALVPAIVPRDQARAPVGLDPLGAAAIAALLLGSGASIAGAGGTSVGGVAPWLWLVIAAVGATVLALWEPRAPHALIQAGLFGRRFVWASVATLLSTGTLMSCFALLPFWLEDAHGASAAVAGAAFLPIGLGIAVTSRRGGRAGDRGRTRSITTAGMLLAACGLALAALGAVVAAWPVLVLGLFVLGCGNGLFSAPNTAAAMAVAPRSAIGSAAGFLSTARNAGVVVGLGITGAVYTALAGGASSSASDLAAASIFASAAVVCVGVALLSRRTYAALAAPRPRRS